MFFTPPKKIMSHDLNYKKKKKEYCVCGIKTEHGGWRRAIAGSFVKTQCNEPKKFLFEVKTLQAVMILEL